MKLEQVGRYEIRRILGRGGVGIVFLARDGLIEREVALKTMRVDRRSNNVEQRRARFLREVRAAGRLTHPGIVTIFDVGEDREQDILFIAMEYVDGNTLEALIASEAPVEPSRAAGVAIAVAEALDYAHFQGVVHRDVKPANIMVGRAGEVKLTDFGIAKLDLFDLTFGGKPIGTPHYMSPEQIRGRAVDGRSDVFSLGLVLFELLTGQRPFGGRTILELYEQIVDRPAPDPVALCQRIPDALGRVVRACLAKDPDDRFQTCGELVGALGELELD